MWLNASKAIHYLCILVFDGSAIRDGRVQYTTTQLESVMMAMTTTTKIVTSSLSFNSATST